LELKKKNKQIMVRRGPIF